MFFGIGGTGRDWADQDDVGFLEMNRFGSGNHTPRKMRIGSTNYNITTEFATNRGTNMVINGTSGYVGLGTSTPQYPLHVVGNASGVSAYFEGNITAAGYVDHTPAFEGDAISAIVNIKTKPKGELDDESLPSLAQASIKVPIYADKTIVYNETVEVEDSETGKGSGVFVNVTRTRKEKIVTGYKTETGRSVGGMVSINVKALQELIEENNQTKQEIEMLKAELCKQDKTYSWC